MYILPQCSCYLAQLFDLVGCLEESSFDVAEMRLDLQGQDKVEHIRC